MAELKPCPFCGGEADLTRVIYGDVSYIACRGCGAMMGRAAKTVSVLHGKRHYNTREQAIEAWNRRAGDGK